MKRPKMGVPKQSAVNGQGRWGVTRSGSARLRRECGGGRRDYCLSTYSGLAATDWYLSPHGVRCASSRSRSTVRGLLARRAKCGTCCDVLGSWSGQRSARRAERKCGGREAACRSFRFSPVRGTLDHLTSQRSGGLQGIQMPSDLLVPPCSVGPASSTRLRSRSRPSVGIQTGTGTNSPVE